MAMINVAAIIHAGKKAGLNNKLEEMQKFKTKLEERFHAKSLLIP